MCQKLRLHDYVRTLRAFFLKLTTVRRRDRQWRLLAGRSLRIVRYLRIGRPQGLGFFQYLNYMWGTPSIFSAFANGLRLIWKETFRHKKT